MTILKYTFSLVLPAKYDPDMPEVEIEYDYHSNPTGTDAIEEIEVWETVKLPTGRTHRLNIANDLPGWLWKRIEKACWAHASKQEPIEQ